MYATNLAIEKLGYRRSTGRLQESSGVYSRLKDQEGDKILGKNELTVREILEHQAGFPPDPQYHNRNYNPEKPDDPQPNANQKLYSQNRDEILQKIIETPLQYVPGTKTAYSDVDYMLLGLSSRRSPTSALTSTLKKLFMSHWDSRTSRLTHWTTALRLTESQLPSLTAILVTA